ncbi:flagellar biosynthetic protein FliO [Robbsia sp. KACC 23696]|uniref:flagellar biosynthetic protein FliO n=1 Tax=Robbsia sp. KACC 23696 TaxID=3149231 RepID=UPI00325B4F77
MTTDAATGAASTSSGTNGVATAAPASSADAGSAPASNLTAGAVTEASGSVPAVPGVIGPVSASHTHLGAPALPVSSGTASSVVIGSAVPSMGAGAMLQAVFGLAVVIALVFACGWVARRLGLKPSMRRGGIVKVIGSAALGARERVVVVEVRDTWLVLGVAAGNVRRLHTMPAADVDRHGGDETGAAAGSESGVTPLREGTVVSTAADADATHDAPPSFQTAFARQLKDRLHGFGRTGNPGGKD